MTTYPGEYLVRWCFNLPPSLGTYVAHLHLICTSADLSPLFLDAEGIRREFHKKIMKEDIPVRMAVGVASAMASIGFILGCLSSVDRKQAGVFPTPLGQSAAPSAERAAWLELAASHAKLAKTLCGQEHIALWLQQALAQADGPAE